MKKLIVYHGTYGCETGCCGHTFTLEDENGKEIGSNFTFTHQYDDGDTVEWAKKEARSFFGADHISDLEWETSIIVDVESVGEY